MATITGNDGNNFLFGTFLADDISGLGGKDDISGRGGDDRLSGGFGDDDLSGDAGNDILIGGPGADRLDGGAGVDTVDYSGSAARVRIFLSIGQAEGGDAEGDALDDIENIVGSDFDDDLSGSDGANVLSGGLGDDFFQASRGADTFDGGSGSDTVCYLGFAAAVLVDLSAGAGLGGEATDDTFISIENVIGAAEDDILIGNAGPNVLDGFHGSDRLIGGRGADTLRGGPEGDTFVWLGILDSGTSVAAMDLIVDFGPLDRIDLSGVDANVFAAGNQGFTFIGAAGFSGTPGEINFIHLNGETIIQLQTGLEGDVEMGIRIAGIVTPEASWFVL